MTIYLLKFIGCSGLLLLFYYGILQNDRLFRFNRFFLLATVAIALIVPITIVKTKIIDVPVVRKSQIDDMAMGAQSLNYMQSQALKTVEPATTLNISLKSVLWSVYALITTVLLIRFIRNLSTIIRLKNQGKMVTDQGVKIVLREDISASFSFLSLMYTNKSRYEQGSLPKEIIEHEKHHITQKHSYDIIYIEFVQCLLWFNPFIYFIKKAIKLNHEFLADQHVLKSQDSAYEYQKILLDITRKQFNLTPVLASNLNYGFTKKRLNMMTKNTNKFKSMIKQIAAAGIIACTFWLGGATRLIAQESTKEAAKSISSIHPVNIGTDSPIELSNGKSVARMSINLLNKDSKVRFEMNGQLITKRYGDLTYDQKVAIIDQKIRTEQYNEHTDSWEWFRLKFKDEELARRPQRQDTIKKKTHQQLLPQPPFKMVRVRFQDMNGKTIEKDFGELSEAQKKRFMDKASKPEFFLPPPPPSYVDDEILADFLDTEKYGVWIDGKRVENSEVEALEPNDIHHFFKSRLFKNAVHYGQYTYQLNIVTREYYKTQPSSKGTWLEYNPQPPREPLPPTARENKNEELEEIAEVPEPKEVPEVFEIVEVPKVTEVKEKPEKLKEKPMEIKVKPKGDLKEIPKVKEVEPKKKTKTVKEKVKN